MVTLLCERCGKETYRPEFCNYCKRKVCRACVKSSKRTKGEERLVICKDCWGMMGHRRKFKSA